MPAGGAVAKDVPVGFRSIRFGFEVESDAEAERLATLAKLTERYRVVVAIASPTTRGSVSVTAV